ncbi:MAG: TIM barrel protein [Gammaproteobacteria bacterium]|nr:TIM barrel protein [Gammaproteobacteria bacterium]
MKLAISNIAWAASEDAAVYAAMRQYGYEGLEIAPTRFFAKNPYDHLHEARQLKIDLLRQHQLSLVSMQSLLFGTEGLYLFVDDSAREHLKAYLKKAILFAETLSCPVLVFGNPKNRISHHLELDMAIARTFFSELGDYAFSHGVSFCLEPNPVEYGTNFMTSTLAAYQFVKQCNSPGFKMICDAGTMILNHEHPDLINQCLDECRHVHVSAPFLESIIARSEYVDHYRHLMQNLKEAGYEHYVSIEMAAPKENVPSQVIECLSIISEIYHGL